MLTISNSSQAAAYTPLPRMSEDRGIRLSVTSFIDSKDVRSWLPCLGSSATRGMHGNSFFFQTVIAP